MHRLKQSSINKHKLRRTLKTKGGIQYQGKKKLKTKVKKSSHGLIKTQKIVKTTTKGKGSQITATNGKIRRRYKGGWLWRAIKLVLNMIFLNK